jgi:formate-nitrite transporter family protein
MPRQSSLVVPVTERDHVKGPARAPITLVEYGDLECPHCALAHPIVHDLADQLGDTLRVVFRHFPLDVHPHAQAAAEATEAAGEQGKFWEMLDLLYQNAAALPEDYTKLAKKVGLDGGRFKRDMERRAYRDRVRADFLGGVRSGVRGTPTLFMNGEPYRGRFEYDAIVSALLRVSRSESPA